MRKVLCANLQQDCGKKTERPGAIYSLMTSRVPQTSRVKHPDLASALCLNEPSNFEHKLQNDSTSSSDPIVDHLMSSYAFKCVVWFFCVALMAVGLTVIVMNMIDLGYDYRVAILLYVGAPVILGIVPVITMCVLPFSRRLR